MGRAGGVQPGPRPLQFRRRDGRRVRRRGVEDKRQDRARRRLGHARVVHARSQGADRLALSLLRQPEARADMPARDRDSHRPDRAGNGFRGRAGAGGSGRDFRERRRAGEGRRRRLHRSSDEAGLLRIRHGFARIGLDCARRMVRRHRFPGVLTPAVKRRPPPRSRRRHGKARPVARKRTRGDERTREARVRAWLPRKRHAPLSDKPAEGDGFSRRGNTGAQAARVEDRAFGGT